MFSLYPIPPSSFPFKIWICCDIQGGKFCSRGRPDSCGDGQWGTCLILVAQRNVPWGTAASAETWGQGVAFDISLGDLREWLSKEDLAELGSGPHWQRWVTQSSCSLCWNSTRSGSAWQWQWPSSSITTPEWHFASLCLSLLSKKWG